MARTAHKLKNNQQISVTGVTGNTDHISAKGRETMKAKTAPKAKARETAAEQRNMILSMFFDEDNDADGFLDLVKHCRIDLAACAGDTMQLPNVIAAHYRLAKGRYDIARAANDLRTYPPIAARVNELRMKMAGR